MGRSTAQLSAPQAAVLLAVLALSAAVPATAAPDRPKEAGPMGCATVDRMVWPDVPKEALAIFDKGGLPVNEFHARVDRSAGGLQVAETHAIACGPRHPFGRR